MICAVSNDDKGFVSFKNKPSHKKGKSVINIVDYFQHILEVLAKMSHIA